MLDVTPTFKQSNARFDAGICNVCKHISNESETRFDFTYFDTRYVLKSSVSNTMSTNLQIILNFIIQGRTDFKNYSVLEIGSGAGEVAAWFADRGADVFTIDPAIEGYENTKIKHHKVNFDKNTPNYIDKKFDLILARHIIEHTDNPGEFLNVSKSFLNDNGKIYIEVPNLINTLTTHRLVDFFNDHMQHFTENSIRLLASNYGLIGEQIGYWLNEAHLGILLKQDSIQYINNPIDIDIELMLNQSTDKLNSIYHNMESATSVSVYGAGAHSCTFVSQLTDTLKTKISHVFDKSNAKHGRYLPGLGIAITNPTEELIKGQDLIVNTSSLYTKEVEQYLIQDLSFSGAIVHL